MVWAFLSGTSNWIKKNKDTFANGERPRTAWKFGPNRLSSAKRKKELNFSIFRYEDAGEKGSVLFKARELLSSPERRKPITPIDVDLEKIRFRRRKSGLSEGEDPFSLPTIINECRFTWDDEDGDTFSIKDDSSLITALMSTRNR
ncbi:hypothetical protein FB567DRAFT_633651 [Paraphoma chrysanthemicola]|uniref:Uncharacterized protein n=1 Tax=Paraphoma chrysanthemicola TaxID=798071 RepID=A0A8K0QTA6_9PLEO|nr:hypothetical protein FB567DRAFT_633651 [Paraphoma chrysanthemicola]